MVKWLDDRFNADTIFVSGVHKDNWGAWQHETKAWVYSEAKDIDDATAIVEQFAAGEFRLPKLAISYTPTVDQYIKRELTWLKKHGARHETDGKRSILMFEQPFPRNPEDDK